MHLYSIFIKSGTVVFILCFFIKSTYEQYIIEVWEPRSGGFQAVLQCDATGADFGGEIPTLSFSANETGCAYFTTPEDSCQDTFKIGNIVVSRIGQIRSRNPGAGIWLEQNFLLARDKYWIEKHLQNNRTGCISYYAVVPRGNCSFSEKAYHAQRGYPDPYSALIVFNDEGHSPVPMAGSKYADRIVIPVVMISHACMTNIMNRFSADKGYLVAIRAIPGYYDLVKYLIPLIAVVGFCFVVLCVSLAVRVCRERRHLAKKRLSKRNLRKLPIKKFRKGDAEESCAICIDDFVDGEKLRVLPCNHGKVLEFPYHCKCIDPWLTKVRKVCPICKRKVLSSGESDSSGSDNEGRESTSTSGSTTVYRENAPLLRNAEALASGTPPTSIQRPGPRRNLQTGRRPPLRVIITSPTDASAPFPATDYLATGDAEIHEAGSASAALSSRIEAVSESIRRSLRPFYHRFVNRSIRAPWRTREPGCASGPSVERPFVVDNNAFEEGSEIFSGAENSSGGDERDPEAVGVFPSEGIAVSERSRHLVVGPSRQACAQSNFQIGNQQNASVSEKVCVSKSNTNVPTSARYSSSISASLIPTVSDLAEDDSNMRSLIDEFGAASSTQQEQR
uniref:RING-type domain-containing protein n=1 Tax=Setaria digitata TaxID=48799 RepID=A0A915PRF9_9BILA